MPSVGWALAVAVIPAICAARSSLVWAAGGNIGANQARPASSVELNHGKATNSSASMFGRWLPWPG
jgi:hypothetical protein